MDKAIPDEFSSVIETWTQIASVSSGVGAVVGAAIGAVEFYQKYISGAPTFEQVVIDKLTAIEKKLDQLYVDLVGLQRASAFWGARQNMDILLGPLIGASLAVQQWANANKNAPNRDTLRFEPVGTGLNEVQSRNALLALAGISFFEQPTIAKPLADKQALDNAQQIGISPPPWAYWANSTPEVNQFGLAFDYRLGVPALLAGITLRLKVMMACEPNFARLGTYDGELAIYADRLRWAAQKVEAGLLTRPRGGFVDGRDHIVVGQDAQGRNVYGGREYKAEIWAEAACLHTGALTSQRITGTFSGQDIYRGNFCPLYYREIFNSQCDTKESADRILHELSLRDKYHHSSAFEAAQFMVRARLAHRIGLFDIHAMIDLLDTLVDGNPGLTRSQRFLGFLAYPDSGNGVIQSRIDRSCLEVVNGYSEGGGRIAIAPMDNTPQRTHQKWVYDRVNGQIRSQIEPGNDSGGSLCLSVAWNHFPNYGTIYWTASGHDAGVARGIRVTTTPSLAPPNQPYNGALNFTFDAQRWTFNPRTGLIRNALGGGLLVLDVQWGSGAAGTPVWIWDINGSNAQRWYAQATGFSPYLEATIRVRHRDYLVRIEDYAKMTFYALETRLPDVAADWAMATGPHHERMPVIDLRDTLDDLEFPLRLPCSGAAQTESDAGANVSNLEPFGSRLLASSEVSYILVHEDGGIELVTSEQAAQTPTESP